MANLDFLQELVNRSADGAYIVNDSQRIIAWNAAAEQILGFQAKDVIGASCYQILGGRTEGECAVCRQGCLPFAAGQRGQLVPSFDARVRTASGHPRWVNISIIAVSVDERRAQMPVVVIHMFRDVESHKRAEAFAKEVAAQARQFDLRQGERGPQPGDLRHASSLTTRELQVLRLLAQGATTESIAATLTISRATARNHIQRIMHKLGVHSRLEAAMYAVTLRPPE